MILPQAAEAEPEALTESRATDRRLLTETAKEEPHRKSRPETKAELRRKSLQETKGERLLTSLQRGTMQSLRIIKTEKGNKRGMVS